MLLGAYPKGSKHGKECWTISKYIMQQAHKILNMFKILISVVRRKKLQFGWLQRGFMHGTVQCEEQGIQNSFKKINTCKTLRHTLDKVSIRLCINIYQTDP